MIIDSTAHPPGRSDEAASVGGRTCTDSAGIRLVVGTGAKLVIMEKEKNFDDPDSTDKGGSSTPGPDAAASSIRWNRKALNEMGGLFTGVETAPSRRTSRPEETDLDVRVPAADAFSPAPGLDHRGPLVTPDTDAGRRRAANKSSCSRLVTRPG